jgi:hypothetical protein
MLPIGGSAFVCGRTLPRSKRSDQKKLATWDVAAPARQGARSAHTGSMQATNNAGGRDAPAAQVGSFFWSEP